MNIYKTLTAAKDYDKCRTGHPETIAEILRRFPLPENGKIADVCCGTGNETQYIYGGKHRVVFGIDKSIAMLRSAHLKMGERLAPIVSDCEIQSAVKDETFSYIFSSFSYHQMQFPDRFFKSILCMLKPGGRFVLLGATLEEAMQKPLIQFFPELVDIESQRYLPLESLVHAFWQAGFVHVTPRQVFLENRIVDDQYLAKAKLRQLDSALHHVSNHCFEKGLQKIQSVVKSRLRFEIYRTVITGVRPHDFSLERGRAALSDAISNVSVNARLEGGALNHLYSATTSDNARVVVKQGLLSSISDRVSGILKKMSPERIVDESKALNLLNRHKPDFQVRIPRVHSFFPDNNILIMEDIRKNGTLMSKISHEMYIETAASSAEHLGRFLAQQHVFFRDKGHYLRGEPERDKKKWLWILHLRTTAVPCEWNSNPERVKLRICEKVKIIAENYLVQTLVNPDLCPKNVFIYPDASPPGIFDFEFCCGLGDPIYDLGFLSAHLIIQSVINESTPSYSGIQKCIDAYHSISSLNGRMNDLAWYTACTLMYRLFGSSRMLEFAHLASNSNLVAEAGNIIKQGGGDFESLLRN